MEESVYHFMTSRPYILHSDFFEIGNLEWGEEGNKSFRMKK